MSKTSFIQSNHFNNLFIEDDFLLKKEISRLLALRNYADDDYLNFICGNLHAYYSLHLMGFLALQTIETALDGAGATPSVMGQSCFLITNGLAQTITNFVLGVEGQVIVLRFADNNTTLDDCATIQLSGGIDKNFGAGDMCILQSRFGVWYQIGGVI